MIINNTGTFYVEGEYAQGDTILKAGDWELRANGSKNAFAYSPETFVRRNLLNWSEDFTKSSWFNNNIGVHTAVKTEKFSPLGSDAWLLTGSEWTFLHFRQNLAAPLADAGCIRFYVKKAQHPEVFFFLSGTIGGFSGGRYVRYNFDNNTLTNIDGNFTAITRTSALLDDGWVEINFSISTSGLASFGLYLNMSGTSEGSVLVTAPQVEQASTPSDYQRTTTHVPRPFAIKDELVTNGTFDTDLSGWNVNFNAFWENGTLVLPKDLGASTNAEISQVMTNLRVGCEYEVTLDIVEQIGLDLRLYPFGRYVSPSYPFLGGVGTGRSVRFTANAVNMTLWFIALGNSGDGFRVVVDNISVKEVQQPLVLGNGNHKDFRYYPKKLSQNETEALTA